MKKVTVFDMYSGKPIDLGKKSLAIALWLQHHDHTLVDHEINEVIQFVTDLVQKKFNATLRE